MRRIIFILLVLSFCLYPQDVIEIAKNDIKTLTSRDMMGRGYLNEGHLKASDYIQKQFQEIGLKKVKGTCFQNLEFSVNLFKNEPVLSINDQALKPGAEFLPFATSGSGNCMNDENIIEVGLGLIIPEKSIDYQGKSIRSAIVIMDDQIPDTLLKDKSIPKQWLSKQTRIQIAEQLKAKAILFKVTKLGLSSPHNRDPIPIFDVLSSCVPPQVNRISYQIKTDLRKIKSRNVFSLAPGSTWPDSTIILCAHYDHLGCMGDSLYFPGANDNASGVAVLLNLARAIHAEPLRYSTLFIAFTGEEAGLCGSKYFAEHPIVDLKKCKFLMNFDMVASGEDGIVAIGGIDHPDYFNLLSVVNDSLNLGPLGKRKNVPNGDHWFITQKGVKGFFLYTKNGKQPYHHVDDKIETLEWDDLLSVYQLALNFLRRL